MPLWDLSLAELEQYSPTVEEPADFDEFWAETIEGTRRHDLGLRLASLEMMLTAVESWDVTFNGFGGHPIRALAPPSGRYDHGPSAPRRRPVSGLQRRARARSQPGSGKRTCMWFSWFG